MLCPIMSYNYIHSILEKHKVFTAFYHLMELRSREDLMALIIENLDYSMSVCLAFARFLH